MQAAPAHPRSEPRLLLGNEAIALGLVARGCRVVTAYPGTPSSEILAGVVKLKRELGREVYTEWSTNEKVAFEVALAASWSGHRAAVAMKSVGLNVAADPLFSAAYAGVRGGFLVISADDPGPHSSQTEQDSRMLALAAKVPVFDPSSPDEAFRMAGAALDLSEAVELPVLLRPTTRLSHALQPIALDSPPPTKDTPGKVRFRKDATRWPATPGLRYRMHKVLNQHLKEVRESFEVSPFNAVVDDDPDAKVGVIASGVAFHTARQCLEELRVKLPLLKLGTPFPLPENLVNDFISRFERVVVLEEPDACIELQITDRSRVHGRMDGSVPSAGELSPEVISSILAEVLSENGYEPVDPPEDLQLASFVDSLDLPVRRPRLCPGCSHRSTFFAVRREFGRRALYPGDIGCYTLGINLRTVDTVLDMGASVGMAAGFHQAARVSGDPRPVVASIGDSTFLHSGVAPLINAVHSGARFVLLILDNSTTAMTGFQPTAQSETTADGSPAARRVSIIELVRACGVDFVERVDPYDQEAFRSALQRAQEHTQVDEGGVAVIVSERPCVLYDPSPLREEPSPVLVTEECDGCRYCVEAFECPAIVLRSDGSRVDIDRTICVDCGQCIDACYKGFIVPDLEPAEQVR